MQDNIPSPAPKDTPKAPPAGTEQRPAARPKHKGTAGKKEDSLKTAWRIAHILYVAVFALLLALLIYQKNKLTDLEQRAALTTAAPFAGETAPPAEAEPEAAAPTVQEVGIPAGRGEGLTIHATVTLPAGAAEYPLVVLCHGFTGNRAGDGHFGALAELLAARGIATAAPDFSGCGESEEPFTAYTPDNMAADLQTVLDYMCAQYPVASDKIGLLGHSMGGRVVSLRLGEDIAAAALWSPADNAGLKGLEFLRSEPDADPLPELEALQQSFGPEGTVDLPRWGVTISQDFVDQVAAGDPCAGIRAYTGPLLIAFAGGDPALLSSETIDGTLQAAYDRGINFVNLYGQFFDATHNYTARTDEADDAAVRARIERLTADFFADSLC